jgi:hypothetical protein
MKKTHELHFAGYDFTSGPDGTTIHRGTLDLHAPGDHGADPLGDGTFRMVPSGDIVNLEERNKRLESRHSKIGFQCRSAQCNARGYHVCGKDQVR